MYDPDRVSKGVLDCPAERVNRKPATHHAQITVARTVLRGVVQAPKARSLDEIRSLRGRIGARPGPRIR